MTSLAPASPKRRASSRPSPRDPPVMTTTLPRKFIARVAHEARRSAAYAPAATAAHFSIVFMIASCVSVRRRRRGASAAAERETEDRVRLLAQVLAVVELLLAIELVGGEVEEPVAAGRRERVRPDHPRVGDEHAIILAAGVADVNGVVLVIGQVDRAIRAGLEAVGRVATVAQIFDGAGDVLIALVAVGERVNADAVQVPPGK